MLKTPPRLDQELLGRLDLIFGSPKDPMAALDARARELLGDRNAIVWEGDAQTFQFSYVSPSSERILGYPTQRWIVEPTFWGDIVVHPEDRDEAIAFCALATGKCEDHDFVYRAVRADGVPVWLHDIVRVITGSRGIAERLRGVMIEIPDAEASHLG